MPRYLKKESEYKRVSFEPTKIKAAVKPANASRNKPTSAALDPHLVEELKAEAKTRGTPYQLLMRTFIVEGFKP